MNANQTSRPFEHYEWINLVNAPPKRGQTEYSQILKRAIASKGANSPPYGEFPNVSEQFTRIAIRA